MDPESWRKREKKKSRCVSVIWCLSDLCAGENCEGRRDGKGWEKLYVYLYVHLTHVSFNQRNQILKSLFSNNTCSKLLMLHLPHRVNSFHFFDWEKINHEVRTFNHLHHANTRLRSDARLTHSSLYTDYRVSRFRCSDLISLSGATQSRSSCMWPCVVHTRTTSWFCQNRINHHCLMHYASCV